MMLYLRLAWRNLWRHHWWTLILVSAIGFTMGMMLWYDGLIGGFNEAIYGNAIKVLGGNIQVHTAGYRLKADQTPILPLGDDQVIVNAAMAQPQVVAASRRIATGGLASNREGAFAVSIDGMVFTNLHSFTAGDTNSDGGVPDAGLVLSGNMLYGTSQYGGSADSGTVFAVSTNGTGFTNLHSFTSGNDGGRLLNMSGICPPSRSEVAGPVPL